MEHKKIKLKNSMYARCGFIGSRKENRPFSMFNVEFVIEFVNGQFKNRGFTHNCIRAIISMVPWCTPLHDTDEQLLSYELA